MGNILLSVKELYLTVLLGNRLNWTTCQALGLSFSESSPGNLAMAILSGVACYRVLPALDYGDLARSDDMVSSTALAGSMVSPQGAHSAS